MSGGAPVFVDQAAEDGFAVDPLAVDAGNGAAATVVFTVGDALGEPPEKAGPCCNAPGIRSGRGAGGAHRGSACVDGTFIWTPSHDQRPCSFSTALPRCRRPWCPEPRSR